MCDLLAKTPEDTKREIIKSIPVKVTARRLLAMKASAGFRWKSLSDWKRYILTQIIKIEVVQTLIYGERGGMFFGEIWT